MGIDSAEKRRAFRKIRVSVALVGLNRSMSFTWQTIENYLLQPLRQSPFVDFHLTVALIQPDTSFIDNPRSGEFGRIENFFPNQWSSCTRLSFESIQLLPAVEEQLVRLKTRSDRWGDNWRSTRNALTFLAALKETFCDDIKDRAPDVVIFCRPDLQIVSKVRVIGLVLLASTFQFLGKKVALLPEWGRYRGVNDRFAVLSSGAAPSYFMRINRINELLGDNEPFHSESFLEKALAQDCVLNVVKTPMLRVRIGGRAAEEDRWFVERLRWRPRFGFWLVRSKRFLRSIGRVFLRRNVT